MTWAPDPDNRFSASGADPADDERADDEWADALARLASDARTDERVAERRRRRGLDEQAAASSTFAGLLENLAEARAVVAVVTAAGDAHRGLIDALGTDVVVLTTGHRRRVLVAIGHVVLVEAAAGRSGDRLVPADRPSLYHLLAELAEERPEVACTVAGGTVVTGRLLWVGEDVLAIAVGTGEHRAPAPGRIPTCRYVRLSSLIDVSPSVSG